MDVVRETLPRLAEERGASLAALSTMLGRNVAYLQQFVARGTPRRLAEDDRRVLAQFLGVTEAALGGPIERDDAIDVPYLTVAAAAGAGIAIDREQVVRFERLTAETLRGAGIEGASASIIDAAGDSMAPTILDGDRLLVDRSDRRVTRRGAVFVLRRDDALAVKRVSRTADALRIASDNPDYPAITGNPAATVIIGRVKLLLRQLR